MISIHLDLLLLRDALNLARRGAGKTSPNPMVGAVLAKNNRTIGRGWHRGAGKPHAEIEAIRDARRRGKKTQGSTLYVTLEPCCTLGRTPPCTEAIIEAGIARVVVGTIDPNPRHCGRAFEILKRAGIKVTRFDLPPGPRDKFPDPILRSRSRLSADCARLNEVFNHWIAHNTPFVIVKAAMTLDGKIATQNGQSRWISGKLARGYGMKLRAASDAIVVGINTILADDPSLTVRNSKSKREIPRLRRIVLDSTARTPLSSKVVSDAQSALTTIVVTADAPRDRVAALERKVRVWVAPQERGRLVPVETRSSAKMGTSRPHSCVDLRWLLGKLAKENVTSVLVEGGGEVNASFLFEGFAQRVAFFYAPKVLGGVRSRPAVAGAGAADLRQVLALRDLKWRRLGPDLLLTALVE